MSMTHIDTNKNKKIVSVISVFLTTIYLIYIILLPVFSLTVLEFTSALLIGIWIFFTTPAYRWAYLHLKYIENNSTADNLRLMICLRGGSGWFLFPLLLSPYFGLRYYTDRLNQSSHDVDIY
jgi:hypothetical protein